MVLTKSCCTEVRATIDLSTAYWFEVRHIMVLTVTSLDVTLRVLVSCLIEPNKSDMYH